MARQDFPKVWNLSESTHILKSVDFQTTASAFFLIAARWTKAVSQSKQDQWTSWENLDHRKFTWKDLW